MLTMWFCTVPLLLAASRLLQENDPSALLEKLRSNSISEREQAGAALERLPLAKLPLLEAGMNDADPEQSGRVRGIASRILARDLGKRVNRFSAKPLAEKEVLERWVRDGANVAKVPEGYERVRSGGRFENYPPEYDYLKREFVLVESRAILSNLDIQAAGATKQKFSSGKEYWVTSFTATEEGTLKLDKAALRLFAQKPNGVLAILADGVMISAPIMRVASFGSFGTIVAGGGREESERMAEVLGGDWFELAVKISSDGRSSSSPDEVRKEIGRIAAFSGTAVAPLGDSGLSLRGPYDSRSQALLMLWKKLRAMGYGLSPLD